MFLFVGKLFDTLIMILSGIYKKVQHLDNQIKLLSELKPELKKRKKVFTNNNRQYNPQLITEKVKKLQDLVSQLNLSE